MTDTPRNIPMPDELNAVREEIRALKTREEELKALILANPDIREGAAWLAEVKEIEKNRVDIKELRAMHKDLVEEYTFPQKEVRIELSAIDAETGEIVSPQRKAWQRRHLVQDVVREWLNENPGQDRLNMPADEFKRRLNAKESLT